MINNVIGVIKIHNKKKIKNTKGTAGKKSILKCSINEASKLYYVSTCKCNKEIHK